jgi:hypothetical protein
MVSPAGLFAESLLHTSRRGQPLRAGPRRLNQLALSGDLSGRGLVTAAAMRQAFLRS